MKAFLEGAGLGKPVNRMVAGIVLLMLVGMAAADWTGFKARAPERAAAESKATAAQLLQQSASDQCREAIEFTNRRAKFGFDVVKLAKNGDILIEQAFSVPVFGMAERDNFTARCVLRKNGNFEFGVRLDRPRGTM